MTKKDFLVLFLLIIIFFTCEIEFEVRELSLKLNEISVKAFWENLKYDMNVIKECIEYADKIYGDSKRHKGE